MGSPISFGLSLTDLVRQTAGFSDPKESPNRETQPDGGIALRRQGSPH